MWYDIIFDRLTTVDREIVARFPSSLPLSLYTPLFVG